jgi:hypothetical protein
MFLALAVILMQAPAAAPAMPVTSYTNSAVVSVAAAPETKDAPKSETKSEAKSDNKDGEKKSDESKEASAPAVVVNTLFPSGSNVAYQPGQTVVTPIDNAILEAPGATYSSSLSSSPLAGGGEPVMLVATKKKRPEAVGIGVPKMWFVLGAMEHGAATFDAWSTRRNIIAGTMHETDPIMRPFANSNAMYAAVQVAPVLFDLLSKQMMRNSHSWVRKSWWVPQSASTVASILSGAHNVAIH